MTETDTAPAEPEFREITVHYEGADWSHKMKRPTEGQTVQIMGLINARGVMSPGQSPEQEKAMRMRAVRHVQVAVALAQGLHADEDDWMRLTMAMAEGTATAAVMFDVIIDTLKAWDEPAEEAEPANRAERRARPSKARRT